MKAEKIIQAWKSEEVLEQLSRGDQAALPTHPAGTLAELSAEELAQVHGEAGTWTVITTSSWVCGVIVTVTVCDELQEGINELFDGSGSNPRPTNPGEILPNKGYCFAADTPVQTASGLRAIQSFQPGEKVLGFDAEAGAVRESRVAGVDVHQGSFAVLDLRAGGDRVEVTTGHLFHGRDGWQQVERLGGERCLDAREQVQSVSFAGARRAAEVYNLRVEGLSSYYVGKAQLLVRDH